VERLQQTILTEHWRVVFRRHYFTSRASLDRSLHGFMQFYNLERPYRGYRVRGRTPATVFHGAVAAARRLLGQVYKGSQSLAIGVQVRAGWVRVPRSPGGSCSSICFVP
jgi:hypothetical protein